MKTFVRAKKRGARSMGGTIRARVKGGLLQPLDKIELPEGKEVTITVFGVPTDVMSLSLYRASGWPHWPVSASPSIGMCPSPTISNQAPSECCGALPRSIVDFSPANAQKD